MNVYLYYDASHIRNYDANGVDVIELLPGTHDEVKAFKYFLKAGSIITPELYADKSVFYIFGKGIGIVKDEEAIRSIDEVCFYAPNYEKNAYSIQAFTDMELVQVIANMDSDDQQKRAIAELHLPFFKAESKCDRYDQDCKTPRAISRTVLWGEFDRLGRLTCGICEARDNAGTIEKGHPEVHQWNYAVGNSNYTMTVGSGEDKDVVDRKAGDWDFIPAGPDHSLYAGSGQEVHYVWVEFNTTKRGK